MERPSFESFMKATEAADPTAALPPFARPDAAKGKHLVRKGTREAHRYLIQI